MSRVAFAALILAGCASSSTVIPRPAGGYSGLLVLEELRLPNGALGGRIEIDAGTRLIANRALPDGEPLYCGEAAVVDAVFGRSRLPGPTCFAWRDGILVVNADRGGGAHTANPIPPGAVREFRLD